MGSCETSPQRELKVHLSDITLETTHVKNTDNSVHSKMLVLLPPQTEMTEIPALAGQLPPLMARRGPGKQSSMAVYSQTVQDPADAEEAHTRNIRGCLPPELKVLKVVTSEEDVTQPWMILIQDCTEDKGDVITHNTEATTTNKEQLDSRQEMCTKTNAQEVEEEEQEEEEENDKEQEEDVGFLEEEGDYLGFDNEISEKAQVETVEEEAAAVAAPMRSECAIYRSGESPQYWQSRRSKGYSESAGGAEDAKHKSSVKKIKQTSRSKRNTDEIQKDDETKYRVFEDNTATSKQKKKKTKEMAKTTESQNTKVKTKKKIKGQPAFIVGKPRAQEVEWKANWVAESERQTPETYERETYVAHQRGVLSQNADDDDDELDKSVSQEQNYTDSEDDMDADTDSVSIEAHEAQDSPRSAYTAQRSHYSQFSVRSHPSKHQLSQTSHRTTSVGMAAQCGPSSPAPLSLIHLPPQTAQHPATDPIKSQSGNNVKTSEEQNTKKQIDTKAAELAERAERRRLEVERKRKGKDEEKSRQQEKEATEERMRMELEEEQNNRAEEARTRKIREVEEKQKRQKEAMERQRREQADKERERRRQEEKKRLVERLQKERQDEEKRQAAELERKRLEEKAAEDEEQKKLLEMEEAERLGYLLRRKEEEEERRKAAEERKRRNEEAAMRAEEEAILQAELFARQRAALEQHLKFHRGLFVEAGGLDQTQDISRPWVFSYFALLKLLGLDQTSAHEDALTDIL
ncbi:hypothetical protein E1301_Tti019663 [Triplophysa tibetana]|uniref:Reticulocyte-binding protein 2-like protein a n=1 Tax=Triplophysa tibetana TaxID=1572043 RepID=A0A5A9P5J4_9TELE|nr:hypothetical protein E1301_Tti019663 [Triplophysa tibetana]